MMRYGNRPNKIAMATALVCSHLEIEFFYFHPEDVNIEMKVIKGKFLEKNKWIEKETSYPDIIDNALPKKGTEYIYEELKQFSYLTTTRIGSKNEVYELMEQDPYFNDVLIPYVYLSTLDELSEFIEKYQSLIIKPARGSKGNKISKLSKSEDGYYLSTNHSEDYYSKDELAKFIKEMANEKKYIVQPYINSITKEGHPFDLRIHLRRGENGEWDNLDPLPRIGIGNSITSNLSQGGAISSLKSFLEAQYGDKSKKIKKQLNEITTTFPEHFQKLYDFEIDAVGIDIGIDENGKLWFFEANTSPGPHYYEIDVAQLRGGYYEYLRGKLNV